MQPKSSLIINNGVPSDIFFPLSSSIPQNDTLRFIAVSWSSNPMKGFATIAKLSLLPKVSVTFVGNWCTAINPEKVHLLKPVTEREIAKMLRDHDVFIHAAKNDPSSNAIIEALACGLPILYEDSGGNSELVKDCGVPLVNNNIERSIDILRAKYQTLRTSLISQQDRFTINNVALKYLNAFKTFVSL